MYRKYLAVQLPVITISFNDELWEYYVPGEEIDVIDAIILTYVHKLPVLISSKQNLDGPPNLEVQSHNGLVYFELHPIEFKSLFPLVSITQEEFNTRLKKLYNLELLDCVQGENSLLYTTTDKYESLFGEV